MCLDGSQVLLLHVDEQTLDSHGGHLQGSGGIHGSGVNTGAPLWQERKEWYWALFHMWIPGGQTVSDKQEWPLCSEAGRPILGKRNGSLSIKWRVPECKVSQAVKHNTKHFENEYSMCKANYRADFCHICRFARCKCRNFQQSIDAIRFRMRTLTSVLPVHAEIWKMYPLMRLKRSWFHRFSQEVQSSEKL